MSSTIYLVNGPNLNTLGQRSPEIYGRTTLNEIESAVRQHLMAKGYQLVAKQSNCEGVLIDTLQEANSSAVGVIINPGAYSHTSIALRDAVSALSIPLVEVHISNIHAREQFRHHSHISAVASAVVVGFGASGYLLAADGLLGLIQLAGTP